MSTEIVKALAEKGPSLQSESAQLKAWQPSPGFRVPSGEAEVLDAWKSMGRGKKVEDLTSCTPLELIRRLSYREEFLMATAALMDQSPTGSTGRALAERLLAFVERGIFENVPTAMAELNGFSEKGRFSERELNWIKFLCGADVQGFCYKNCQAFRADSDYDLENRHDYIQIVFPSWAPSQYGNQDLYIRDKAEIWKKLLKTCPNVRHNIYLNMQLNAIRMLHFWRFRFTFIQDDIGDFTRTFVSLVDNPNSPLHKNGDHNTLRATRFIEALEMFGCFGDFLKIFSEGLLPEYYSSHPSWKYWYQAWEKTIRLCD
jgi:hypothetical protein